MAVKPKSTKKANGRAPRKEKYRVQKVKKRDRRSTTARGSPKRPPSKPCQTKIPVSSDPLEKNCLEKHQLPQGYVFVPKGDVYVTRHCRSRTKEFGQLVYVIYHKSGKRALGLQVPSNIYSAVLDSAAATAESRANAVRNRDQKDQSRARQSLRKQFPLMPVDTLEKVLNHAYLKGSGRVGRSTTMSDERKMVLAVEAHIRHTHTPYEALLGKGLNRREARNAVWDTVRDIRNTWEGSNEQDTEPSDDDLALDTNSEVDDVYISEFE